MLYFTGDTHGDIQRFAKRNIKTLKNGDTLFVCGDFGFVWDNSSAEQKMLNKLTKLPFLICFIDGTHENFKLLDAYPVVPWHGAKAHKIRDNIFHLMRGQLYDFEGKTVFALGGGENPELVLKDDEEITERPEVPTKEEMLAGVESLEKAQYKVDYVITHEPPAKVRDFLMLSSTENSTVTALGAYLDELAAQTEYGKWFFGSIHTDKFISSSSVSVFSNIIEGESGKKIN